MPAGERSMSGSRNLLISVPRASAFDSVWELVAELEVLEDVLDVGREAVEVVLEVGQKLLLAAARLEVAQRELRCVVERLARGITQRGALLGDARLVEHLLGLEHLLLGRLEHRVHAPDDAHRQDHIGYLPRLKRSRRTSSAMPQMKETILLCVCSPMIHSLWPSQ
jgi:hypothetical protein